MGHLSDQLCATSEMQLQTQGGPSEAQAKASCGKDRRRHHKKGENLRVLTTEDEGQCGPGDVGHQARKDKSNQLRKRHAAMGDVGEQAVQ